MLRNPFMRLHGKHLGAVLLLSSLFIAGCTHLAIEDCGGAVLGKNEPRIRSSHYRMLLANLPGATERFLPFAAMSSLTYAEDQDCGTPPEEQKILPEYRDTLEHLLHVRGWKEVRDPLWVAPCEDDTGLYLRVWERDTGARKQVVIAFRGTWGFKDWVYGNAHWLTRFLPMDDQFSRARAVAQTVLDHYDATAEAPPHYFTTGHSLGGGLAQHILYANPRNVIQAIAFDPSSVTGFADQTDDNQIAGCSCTDLVPEGEPRIFRVYDAYEILANLRIFHKVFFPPERHVQEVRFPNQRSHSMLGLTEYLHKQANAGQIDDTPWNDGVGERSPGVSCTQAFIAGQQASCSVNVSRSVWSKCPQ